MNTIATVTGKLTLTIADSPAIDLGNIKIPISAKTNLHNDGELVLTATPNMRQVRELIEQAFLATHQILEDIGVEKEKLSAHILKNFYKSPI